MLYYSNESLIYFSVELNAPMEFAWECYFCWIEAFFDNFKWRDSLVYMLLVPNSKMIAPPQSTFWPVPPQATYRFLWYCILFLIQKGWYTCIYVNFLMSQTVVVQPLESLHWSEIKEVQSFSVEVYALWASVLVLGNESIDSIIDQFDVGDANKPAAILNTHLPRTVRQ